MRIFDAREDARFDFDTRGTPRDQTDPIASLGSLTEAECELIRLNLRLGKSRADVSEIVRRARRVAEAQQQ